jgi:hypothetical protein
MRGSAINEHYHASILYGGSEPTSERDSTVSLKRNQPGCIDYRIRVINPIESEAAMAVNEHDREL